MVYIGIFAFLCWVAQIQCLWDNTILSTGVWLSGAAYCEKDSYTTMILGGPATGFVYKETLHDIHTDVQGYIGVMPSTDTIYVVIRGSSSVLNWLDDFEIKLVDYTTYPDCGCTVHNGFYRSALAIRNKTIDTVRLLKKKYNTVVLTGHSYGASVSLLLAMELYKVGIEVDMYNYGQPRAGNPKFADFVNTVIGGYWRTTHYKDIVPHVPPIVLGYQHACGEIYEDETGTLNHCSDIFCEDTQCSNQYALVNTTTEDHSYYLGHRVNCEQSTINITLYLLL